MSSRKDRQIRRAAAEIGDAIGDDGDAQRMIFRAVKRAYLALDHRARAGGILVAKAKVLADIQKAIAAQPPGIQGVG